MKETALEKVLTAIEAAEMLDVTRRQISRLCALGKLTHRKDNAGNLLITKESVIEYQVHRK
ncbi:helix-turn-helix domain-containing protein [Paenibacillus sp. 1P07SE]|uniref:helix-turn-helix domain-containing protein n=1 Tax=Paenibacillus sp. 1P07SE TaxID=3132209 RepID=UPI0039A5F9D9